MDEVALGFWEVRSGDRTVRIPVRFDSRTVRIPSGTGWDLIAEQPFWQPAPVEPRKVT